MKREKTGRFYIVDGKKIHEDDYKKPQPTKPVKKPIKKEEKS